MACGGPSVEKVLGALPVVAEYCRRLDLAGISISLYGAYEQAEEDFATPKFGHPKDRRPDLNQIQAGLAVTGDGGIPVWHRGYDGGAGEIAQVAGAMTALKTVAGPRRFLLVGDSKLVSYGNLRAMTTAEVEFIAPASKQYVSAAELAVLDTDAAAVVDYVAECDAGKPTGRSGTWRVLEDVLAVPGKKKKDPVLRLRRVFVHSSARPPRGPRSSTAPRATCSG